MPGPVAAIPPFAPKVVQTAPPPLQVEDVTAFQARKAEIPLSDNEKRDISLCVTKMLHSLLLIDHDLYCVLPLADDVIERAGQEFANLMSDGKLAVRTCPILLASSWEAMMRRTKRWPWNVCNAESEPCFFCKWGRNHTKQPPGCSKELKNGGRHGFLDKLENEHLDKFITVLNDTLKSLVSCPIICDQWNEDGSMSFPPGWECFNLPAHSHTRIYTDTIKYLGNLIVWRTLGRDDESKPMKEVAAGSVRVEEKQLVFE